MNSYNSFSLLILFSFLLFFTPDFAVLTVSCPTHCGGIEIVYPFGVGKGCYLEKWYEITCNTSTSGKLAPFLSVINKEVVGFSLPSQPGSNNFPLPYRSVSIKNPITSRGCSSNGEELELGGLLNLTGTPFYISYTNTLIALGCDNTATLSNVEPIIVQCKSSCNTATPIKDYLALVNCEDRYGYIENCHEGNITEGSIDITDASCNGIRCCKAYMPDTIQQIVGVTIENTTTRGCKVAFLTNKATLSNESDPQRIHARKYSTVELGWFIHTANRSFVKSLGCYSAKEYMNLTSQQRRGDIRSCVCDNNVYLSYARCLCIQGFRGNPYRLGECKG
ncbi:unnamed protein product [Arabidopsis arenosa]|uniref:Wall-associated receptor kinase n=1 Tax=Arabidopsis arenosa TaxID=38785 RepID=A0A8S1ZRJ5_ARAAE|nr:unnamed protein product [Arabidopsis arenosa]